MYALVFKEKVVEVQATKFPVHSNLSWVDLTDISPQPEYGWTYDGATFKSPPEPAASEAYKVKVLPSPEQIWEALKRKGVVIDADL